MNIKPYDIFILEKYFLESIKDKFELNENASDQEEWVKKIINENTIEGLENLLIEMDAIDAFNTSETLNELKLWDDLKAWGQRKLDKLRQKYEEFIDSDTFKKVHDFIEGGGELPDNERERKRLEKKSPDLEDVFGAMDIMKGGDDTLDALKKGSTTILKQFGLGKKKKKKKKTR